jgi:hypothetical protein
MDTCTKMLEQLLTLYPHTKIWTIDQISEQKLRQLRIEAYYIRHPSHGNKAAFMRGMANLPRRNE